MENEHENSGSGYRSSNKGSGGFSIDEFLTKDLIERAKGSSEQLRNFLKGTISIEFRDGKKFFFVCGSDGLSLTQESDSDAECKVILDSKDFEQLVKGYLNPQIGMLSDKIRVTGKTDLALYFFNLVSPRN